MADSRSGGRRVRDRDPFDDDPFDEPTSRRGPVRAPRSSPPAPLRGWRSRSEGGIPDEWDEERSDRPGPYDERPPVYWRARDSLYFEPLVALAIVALLLVGLFTYTQNWPPAYVVESNSMQHGSGDTPGLINAGDLVLATKVPVSSIVPYVTGVRTGWSTYGEAGDVLLYYPFGDHSQTPLVHRSILYLQWDPAHHAYNVTDLEGLPCGDGSNRTAGQLYYSTGGGNPCSTTEVSGDLQLFNVGWNSTRISIDLSSPALGNHSGFLTMGDGNSEPDQQPQNANLKPSLSPLVEAGWIIGVARGMIPWFGAFKLLLEGGGHAALVPAGSWQFLGLSILAVIFIAYGVHYLLRREGVESPIRRREEEEEAFDADLEERPAHPFLESLRPWRRDEDDDEPEPPRRRAPAARAVPSRSPPPRATPPPRNATGRPRPSVHRSRRRDSDDDDM